MYSQMWLQNQVFNLSIERLSNLKCVQVHKQLWLHIQVHFATRTMNVSKVFKYEQVTFAFSIWICLKDGQDFNYLGTESPPFWTSIQNSTLQESFLSLLTCCLLNISIFVLLIKTLILLNLTQFFLPNMWRIVKPIGEFSKQHQWKKLKIV